MKDEHVVIGEGTYGCVHKPSLECDNKKINYRNKVSKLLSTKEADKEITEYKIIENIDHDNEFYLGNPVKCDVKKNTQNIKSISKCKNGEKFLKDIQKLSLLIMEDGGKNLAIFARDVKKWEINKSNIEKIELFWIEAHRILLGLKAFIDNDIVHHDLKPQNIVYDIEKNRINFIDFGFMTTKKKILNKSKNSEYYLSNFHWSFPFEIEFYNKNKYIKYSKESKKKKAKYYNTIIDDLKTLKDVKSTKAINTFFSHVIKPELYTDDNYEESIEIFLKDYYRMIINNMTEDKYDEFLEKSVNTIDIYGVGIAFFFVFNYSFQFLNEYAIENFTELFYYMVSPNLYQRYDINTIIEKYENILENSGILRKYNKHFENHELKDGPSIPNDIDIKINSISKEDVKLSKEEIQKNIMESPHKQCPEGKVLNKATNRCIKKRSVKTHKQCPEGKVLNKTTNRCIKHSVKTQKQCPEGKVLNKTTNRCIKHSVKTQKQCPEGKVLNKATNRCIKKRSVKTQKQCPEGKVLNKTTNRCIKHSVKTRKNKIHVQSYSINL